MSINTIIFDLDDTLLWDKNLSKQHLRKRVNMQPQYIM